MSTIDTSSIDPSKPQQGSALTVDLRTNLSSIKGALDAAKTDLVAVEGRATTLEGRATALENDVAALVTFQSGDKMREERSLSGYESTIQVAGVVAGGDFFDPREHVKTGLTRTIQFRAVLSTSDVGKTAHVQLYNLTDSVQVTGGDLSTASATPVELTLDLIPGTTGGFPDGARLYEVRFWEALGTGAESAILHKASFDVIHEAP